MQKIQISTLGPRNPTDRRGGPLGSDERQQRHLPLPGPHHRHDRHILQVRDAPQSGLFPPGWYQNFKKLIGDDT